MKRPRVSGDELLADTGTVIRKAFRRSPLVRSLSALVAVFFLGGAAPASADPRPLAATVLAVRAEHVYVAADSGALATGDRLAFADRKRVLATGTVAGLLDGRIASVRLESGTLDRVKKLDRLHVTAENTGSARVALLHVGIPAGARRSRVTACAACTLAALPGWRSERAGPAEWRAIHEAAAETLLVRLFRDADDEAIAWERGDLDVAVFWPDELSASQRARFRESEQVTAARTTEVEVRGEGATIVARRDCPILVRAADRSAFDRIGAGRFADLPACHR